MLEFSKWWFWVTSWLAAPVFEGDSEKTRLAVPLNRLLLLLLLCLLLILPFSGSPHPLTLFLTVAGLLFLLRKGYVRFVKWLMIVFLWGELSWFAWNGGGVRALAFNGYVIIMVWAALFLRRRRVWLITSLSVMAGLFMVFAEQQGFLPGNWAEDSTLMIWSTQSAIFIFVTATVSQAYHRLHKALAHVHQELAVRQQAEEALRESESRFATFMEYLPANVTIKDHESRFLFANKHMRDLFDADSWNDKTAREYFPPDIADNVLLTDQQALVDGPLAFEEKVPIKTGEFREFETWKFPIKREGKPALIGIISVDITERKAAEAAIRESEERYRRLVELSPDAITLTDLEGKILMANRQSAQLHGCENPDELVGKDTFALIAPEDRQRARENLRQTLLHQEIRDIEYSMLRKNGERFMAELNVSVLMDASGKPNMFIGIVRDITERKQIEENIRRLNEDLELRVHQRTAELEAANTELKEFAYVVSHDLKAPLRGINRLVQWLVEDFGDTLDEKGKEMADLLIGRVERMDNLIEGILHYSRIGRIHEERQAIDLNVVVHEVLDLLNLPDHIQMTIAPDLPTIVAERTRIFQVFENLIGNAVKFMDNTRGEIRVRCQDDGRYWTFSVTDNGPGIEERHQERIFSIFQTLHARDELESTGIGLALVKKIVELYGGKIWVSSTVGQGSTFFFTFPKE